MAKFNYLNAKTLEKQYKDHLSDFRDWVQIVDPDCLVFPENMGTKIAIDETALHNGELYTIVTNRDAGSKKGTIIALIKGTPKRLVDKGLTQIPVKLRWQVQEVTCDFSSTMDWICRDNFPQARRIGDRFHIQAIIYDAVQDLRIQYRHEALAKENQKGPSKRYTNGDTEKELLARSRYLLFKPSDKWTDSQRERAVILFRQYPDLEQAYLLAMNFRDIFEHSRDYEQGKLNLRLWVKEATSSGLKPVLLAVQTVKANSAKILNYFPNRTTNAYAESFNSKLKNFRALMRGICDIKFFLFRVTKLYA